MHIKKYGLIGHPLSHSFSEKYFKEKFEKENISNCSYQLLDINNINLVSELIETTENLKGLNVTIPYKEKILPFFQNRDLISCY